MGISWRNSNQGLDIPFFSQSLFTGRLDWPDLLTDLFGSGSRRPA